MYRKYTVAKPVPIALAVQFGKKIVDPAVIYRTSLHQLIVSASKILNVVRRPRPPNPEFLHEFRNAKPAIMQVMRFHLVVVERLQQSQDQRENRGHELNVIRQLVASSI